MLNRARSESDICSVLRVFKMCDLPTGFPHFFLVSCLANTFFSVFYLFNYQPTAVAVGIMSGLLLLCSVCRSMNPVCVVFCFSLRKKKLSSRSFTMRPRGILIICSPLECNIFSQNSADCRLR